MAKTNDTRAGCSICANGANSTFDISMAFQPIVDTADRSIFAYEALVRGAGGESAGTVFEQVNDGNRYNFDQACRVTAIEWAAHLSIETWLSINFMPNAVYEPERCIQTTLRAAERFAFPTERIIFEITEGERVDDPGHLDKIIRYYQAQGFLTAIDDFGAGYAGLSLLADFRTDLVKLDMGLVRDIDQHLTRQAIVRATLSVCDTLNIRAIAEGVETRAELDTLREMGVNLFQGYLLAKPGFQSLPEVDWTALD